MPNPNSNEQQTITQAAHASAVAEAGATAAKAATEAERTRLGAIVNSEEAQGRTDLANYFAYETDMSAEDAKKALAKAPVEHKAEEAESDPLADAMSSTEQPNVGADGSNNMNESKEVDLNAALNLAAGVKY